MPRLRGLVACSLAVVLLGAGAAASPAGARPIGGQPFDDSANAANAAVLAHPNCGLGSPRLAAMMLSVVFHETGATGTVPPSPMTLSRWDVSPGLFAFGDQNTPFPRAYFNPGVGMWQFDSAGLGAPRAASFYMNTATAAPVVAAVMAARWCARPDLAEAARRAHVWSQWHACAGGACEVVYNEIFDGTTLRNLQRFDNVSRTGGMQARRCHNRSTGAVVDCWWVNPALAEGHGAGSTAWANPNSANPNRAAPPSPLSAPFYVYEDAGREYRHWIAADTGYGGDITASRPLNQNARTSLTWSSGPGVCDVTLGRGACVPEPPLGPNAPTQALHPSMAGPGRGPGLTAWNGQVALAERRSDGNVRVSSVSPPLWSGWTYLGGVSVSDVDLLSWGGDHLQAFVLGTDGAVWQGTLVGGGFSGWSSLGGRFSSAPTAVSWAPGRVDVFVRGLDGALWTGYLVDGAFSGWSSLGGGFISDPTVASWGPNRLDVFATGRDAALWHRAWDGGQWLPWESLGGTLGSSPGAASPSVGRIDIAARVPNGSVYVTAWNGTSWTGWSGIGGSIVSAPDVAAFGGGVMAMGRAANGALYRAHRVGSSWTSWSSVP